MGIDARKVFENRGFGITFEQANQRLGAIYDELNATRFHHELPKEPWIRVSLEIGGARASFKNLGPCVSIFVSPFCEPERYERTLLHEMCHFFSDGHDEAFQKKLAEVAEGEPWLQEELDECEQWRLKDHVRQHWIGILSDLSEKHPDMRWTQARSLVAYELGCKLGVLRDVAPDFKETWSQFVALGNGRGKTERALFQSASRAGREGQT